jgi:hypothetical protein
MDKKSPTDYYGPAWMGILKQIRREKDQRRHELLVIDRRKQKLSEWKKRLEQMQYDLTARESRILESEAYLPLARQLQQMKLALEDALPWIETIREKAEAENVDIRTTAINVAQELRNLTDRNNHSWSNDNPCTKIYGLSSSYGMGSRFIWIPPSASATADLW